MTGIRIMTRANLKLNMSSIYTAINENNPSGALYYLNSAENDIIAYYNSRGLNCERFYPIIAKIRSFLKRFKTSNMYKRKLFNYLLELHKELKAPLFSQQMEKNVDVEIVLKHLSDELIDDYSEFNFAGGRDALEHNKNTIELMRNDLLEMKELEPLFLKEKFDCSDIMIAIHNCLMVLPQVNDVSVAPATIKIFRTYFETLFGILSKFSIPEEIKKEEPVEKQEQMVQKEPELKPKENIKEDIGNESVGKLTKDLKLDLKEMERKAKERLINSENEPELKPEEDIKDETADKPEKDPGMDLKEMERKAKKSLMEKEDKDDDSE